MSNAGITADNRYVTIDTYKETLHFTFKRKKKNKTKQNKTKKNEDNSGND